MDESSDSFGEYLQNILEQPQALRDTVARWSVTSPVSAGEKRAGQTLTALHVYAKQLEAGEARSVILTGMGASYHALQPLTLQLVKHGVSAQRIETSELVHHAPRLLHRSSLVIAVSQSGQSAEIVKLLERRGRDKFPLLGVTNTAASPLASASDTVILTHAGSEYSVSSKTYIATLTALELLGAVLTRDEPGPRRIQLEQTATAMEQYLAHWRAYVADLKERLKEIEQLVLVGRGASLAAVGAGALIVREAARFPCQELSSAAFRHGPLEMISPKMFVLVFRGTPPTIEPNERLVADLRALGGNAALVQESSDINVFALPPVAPATLPLLEFLVPEMLSLALARLRGHIPGNFVHASKITLTE